MYPDTKALSSCHVIAKSKHFPRRLTILHGELVIDEEKEQNNTNCCEETMKKEEYKQEPR
jgi:hypothetical protein